MKNLNSRFVKGFNLFYYVSLVSMIGSGIYEIFRVKSSASPFSFMPFVMLVFMTSVYANVNRMAKKEEK